MTNPTPRQFSDWYSENRERHNQSRREAYARDPKARDRNRERSREWRRNRAEGAPVERKVYRMINGKKTRVYSVGQIADRTGYAPSTLRLLISNGELPEPTLPGAHRYYTAAEVKKIESLLRKRR